MIYDFQDYRNRSLRITDNLSESDSPYIFPEPIASLIRKASLAVLKIKHDKHIEKKLKKWIEQYPQVPMFKNILCIYYINKNKDEKAFEYNKLIAGQHPDYIFGKLNLLEKYLSDKELDKVEGILGTLPDIFSLTNSRQIFHLQEYVQFHSILIRYWVVTGNTEEALEVFYNLEKLEDILDLDLDLYNLNDLLCQAGIIVPEQEEDELCVRTEPTLPQTTTPPVFNFPQIQWLYQNGFSIEKDRLEELLKLPREPLINDLCEVLYDAIRRYDHFYEMEFDSQTHSGAAHALYLLMELKATESLPAVLELFRQPEELLELWLGDLLSENIWQVVYAIGQTQLPVLEIFLKEPNNYTYGRTAVSTAISQLALHQPTRRQEVVEVYERLLHFYFENQDNQALTEWDFITLITSDVVDFNGIELTSLIKQFYDADLVDKYLYRDWHGCLKELNTPDDQRSRSEKRSLQSCFEIRDIICKYRFAIETAPLKHSQPASLTSAFQPFINPEPKIGRNDPCPCGSGKKFKKCCGKEDDGL